MFWLDLAVASRRDAERAFFDLDDVPLEDDIPRERIEDLSEYELAHLGMLLCEGFEPDLVLDGDAPDEIVTACDPRLVAALAALSVAELPALALRWQVAGGHTEATLALTALKDLAELARERAMPLLYAQGSDRGGEIGVD
ncbi:MAG: hypothetical protein KDH20_14295 [Rhodocyclaceae bacterium]|nr:hypothetical protein [Rhodocyclaceae bacterium]